MKNQSFTDIIGDQNYVEGYNAGVKMMQKKYNKLKADAKHFFSVYESANGAPDENDPANKWYFELRAKLGLAS